MDPGVNEKEQGKTVVLPETAILCMLPGYEQTMVTDTGYLQVKGLERITRAAQAVYHQTEQSIVMSPPAGVNAPIEERANFVTECVKSDLREVGLGQIAGAIEKCGLNYDGMVRDPSLGKEKTENLLLQTNNWASEQVDKRKEQLGEFTWEKWMGILSEASSEVAKKNGFGERESVVSSQYAVDRGES